jgi:hypothetical protein
VSADKHRDKFDGVGPIGPGAPFATVDLNARRIDHETHRDRKLPKHGCDRTFMKDCFKLIAFPLLMTAIDLTVIGSRSRHVAVDKFCLMAVIALGSAFYIKKRWLALLAFGFAAVLLVADVDVPGSGLTTNLFKSCATLKIPPPREFDMRDFIDYLDYQSYAHRVNQEISLYSYFFATTAVFTTCVIADRLLPCGGHPSRT